MIRWIENIIFFILGATLVLNIAIGFWPDENTFENGVWCTAAALNLRMRHNNPPKDMEDIFEDAKSMKIIKRDRWLK